MRSHRGIQDQLRRVPLLLLIGLLPCSTLPSASFIRGDVDENRDHEITDGIRIFGYLFLGSPTELPCLDAALKAPTGPGSSTAASNPASSSLLVT